MMMDDNDVVNDDIIDNASFIHTEHHRTVRPELQHILPQKI